MRRRPLYESLFRANVLDSHLFSLSGNGSVTKQLALVPDADAADLVALVGDAVQTLAHLFESEVIANPTFAGSLDVSGTDGPDRRWLSHRHQTTKQPGLDRMMIDQFLGYILLDYEDEFALRR